MLNSPTLAGASSQTPDIELRALLRRVAERDRYAFRRLYHVLRPPLVRHLQCLLRRPDQVEEVLNDVMWVVWQNAGTFRGDARVTTWVLGIATMKSRRVWARWQRDQARLDELTPGDDEALVSTDGTDHDLAAALAQLSADHRDALELTYYFGYSCSEVAALRGCPVGTVKTRLFHARRRLKALLQTSTDEAELT